jgi:hypothetical protein
MLLLAFSHHSDINCKGTVTVIGEVFPHMIAAKVRDDNHTTLLHLVSCFLLLHPVVRDSQGMW